MLMILLWVISGVFIAYIAYQVGYLMGYTAGLDYGMKKFEDYHQHTLTNLRNMKFDGR
jgi:hypothetical protein